MTTMTQHACDVTPERAVASLVRTLGPPPERAGAKTREHHATQYTAEAGRGFAHPMWPCRHHSASSAVGRRLASRLRHARERPFRKSIVEP